MRFLPAPSRSFFYDVEPALRADFARFIARKNATKARLVAWVGVVFTLVLGWVDLLRLRAGALWGHPVHEGLLVTHVLLGLMIIPALWLGMGRLRTDPRAQRLGAGLVLGLCIASLLPMAVLSLIDRDTVAMFGVLMFVVNLVFTLPHTARLALNVLALVPLAVTVLLLHGAQPLAAVLQLCETAGLALPAFIFATVQYNLQASDFRGARLLAHEKDRSEALLRNILPAAVAQELKENGWVKPRFYPEASILFADFAGFSHICRTLTPEQLIDDLNYCFRSFDEIIEKHGLERIKTIGDAYMAVGGLTDPGAETTLANPAQRMVAAALDMQIFLSGWAAEREIKNLPIFAARIGIHTGPVVAGVAGATKFAFDVWGDAVNIAARIESAGEPFRVNVSGASAERLDGRFRTIYRGNLPVKNIGEQPMFFVENHITIQPYIIP